MNRLRSATIAKVVALVTLPAAAGLGVLLFVVPAYATQGCSATFSPVGAATTTCASSGATLLAVNPGSAPLLISVSAAASVASVLAVTTAWLRWQPARWILAVVLAPLSGVAMLGAATIGVFILPVVALGWVTFGLCGSSAERGAQPPGSRG